MDKNEIMKIYSGWDNDVVEAISRYVDKFHRPWPVYCSQAVELIDYCVKRGISIDDLPEDDPISKKYDPKGIIY